MIFLSFKTPLMDQHFSYMIDVSNVGCHCNSAAYFIDMPANQPGPGGDYYCDANHGNELWCPEYDTWEGNRHTVAGSFKKVTFRNNLTKYLLPFPGTLHTCDGGNGNWYSCDRGGCQTNAFNVNNKLMCPDASCTINTQKYGYLPIFKKSNIITWVFFRPFTVSHFQNSGISNIWFEQEGRTADFNICNDGGYVSRMAQSYDGMVFSASLWGE